MARAKKDAAAAEAPNFEQNLEALEEIVGALEEGGLSLDDALKRFEEGIRLARCCEKALTEAEKRIEILTRNAQGELEPVPFEEGAGETLAALDADMADEIRDEGEDLEEEGRLLF